MSRGPLKLMTVSGNCAPWVKFGDHLACISKTCTCQCHRTPATSNDLGEPQ